MTGFERFLIALAALAALLWGVVPGADSSPAWLVAVKGLAVAPLALLALSRRREGGVAIGVALAAHAVGDVLIELAPFLCAVAAFGVGHLLYVRAFLGARRRWREVTGGPKLLLGALALAGGLLAPRVLAAAPGPLALPIGLYILLLLGMAGSAQLSRRGQPWVASGAVAFVASDALLGLERFAGDQGPAGALNWPLYWGGQAAIALGWLGDRDRQGPGD